MKRYILLLVLLGCGPPVPPSPTEGVGITRNLASPLSNEEAAEMPSHEMPNRKPDFVDDAGRRWWRLEGGMIAVDSMGNPPTDQIPEVLFGKD